MGISKLQSVRSRWRFTEKGLSRLKFTFQTQPKKEFLDMLFAAVGARFIDLDILGM
jgi:hypothetical protein